MKFPDILDLYIADQRIQKIVESITGGSQARIHIKGIKGSGLGIVAAGLHKVSKAVHLIILEDKEQAAYVLNDLENLLCEKELPFEKRKVLFYPTSYKRPYEIETIDNANVLSRTEVMNKINAQNRDLVIVTYPEALSEKVVTKKFLQRNTLSLKTGEEVSMDFLADVLSEYNFERVDFVVEPGQFAIRGGIVDVFSFSHEYPYRIEFEGDEIGSVRTFNPGSQLSIQKIQRIQLIPNIQDRQIIEIREAFLDYIPSNSVVWLGDITYLVEKIESEFSKAEKVYQTLSKEIKHATPAELFLQAKEFEKKILDFSLIGFGTSFRLGKEVHMFNMLPQPSFNKNFNMLLETLQTNSGQLYYNFVCSDNQRQIDRLTTILSDLAKTSKNSTKVDFKPLILSLHEGFIDQDLRVACFTDHQIFERYHRFHLREGFSGKESLTLKELYNLQPGDYVSHIDHGIGRFDGLEIIENNGKHQEAIRLFYKNNDVLYVSIHSLHRIAKYSGKDAVEPVLNRLGSNAWSSLKNKTKQKVKDIARNLISLYSKRKASEGFAFLPDTYLQYELEASFIYEDTPDQIKATADVKADMEKLMPMDRLVCGDVGFGKTEIAIRAAFKAVTDNKQVAILVPTTILALQHYKTFRERLKDFPCKVEYINRFKTAQAQKETLMELEAGKVDILIGTHRLISKDVKFKDLGLLIIDEEQKFGVSAKEKLKEFRVNVDSLTLTATPIPRTLQFSLLGARDLSVINTPPPNRQPVHTEIRTFGEEVIRDAIRYELGRGGQVFFVHNRVQNIIDVAGMIKRFVPDAKIAIAHGQMDGKKLEAIMLDFIDGDYDILVATTIIESGLDIPNVNTIIINDAHHYGLSDLHQLRGRVGRSNKKAFCYLLSPPLSSLTDEARKRLRAIEEFSNLGSGFNIAMRDLDIRGAGNLLGAEQSGFIADIGYEMYQKILDEAIRELKDNEFKGLYPEDASKPYVAECVIETDLEILIPVYYIGNLTERLSLYKELDNIEDEDGLAAFRERLTDRFGPIPEETEELINTMRLRWMAREYGIEKLALKNGQMICFFVANQESPFFQTDKFTSVLRYVQSHPKGCRMKENGDKLTLTFINILSVSKAYVLLTEMSGSVN